MDAQGLNQKVMEKLAELQQDYERQTSYIHSATRAIKNLRQDLKKATLVASKLEGAIEAFKSTADAMSQDNIPVPAQPAEVVLPE